MDEPTELPTKPTGRVYCHPETGEYWVPVAQVNEFSTFNFETGIKRGRELERATAAAPALTLAAKVADAYFEEQGYANTVLGDRIRNLIRNPSP